MLHMQHEIGRWVVLIYKAFDSSVLPDSANLCSSVARKNNL